MDVAQQNSWSLDRYPMSPGPCDQSAVQYHDQPVTTSDSEFNKWLEALSSDYPQSTAMDASAPDCGPSTLPQAVDSIEGGPRAEDPMLPASSSLSSSFCNRPGIWPPATIAPPFSLPPTVFENQPWNGPAAFGNHIHGEPLARTSLCAQLRPQAQPFMQHASASPGPMMHRMPPLPRFDGFGEGGFPAPAWERPEHNAPLYDAEEIEEDDCADAADPCYAQLLYRCLKETEDHTMSLKELYEWVAQHSQKAKDMKNRGWQNSVRHNLSMNAAFERVHPSTTHGPKKGSLWRLTPKALEEGVISTTRYRKDPKRKPERRSSPALKRQISGAKGGRATREASQRQRAMQARSFPNLTGSQRHRRHQRRQDPHAFLSPISYNSPLHSCRPSPQPIFPPHPPSPYFLDLDHQQSITSNPHTPPDMIFDLPTKPLLSEFEFQHIDYETGGLFGNFDQHPAEMDTPSLTTEVSFADDGLPALSQRGSRERTVFQ